MTQIPTSGRFWQPIWLRLSTLLLMLLIFTILLVNVILIHLLASQNNGFYITAGTSHYAWTYGPTAIMTSILWIWSSIDYDCRSLSPWQTLFRGPTSAAQSLTLDYLTPIPPSALWKSLKNRDVAVAASITAGLLLHGIMILSTSWLVLSQTLVNYDFYTFEVNSTFHTPILTNIISDAGVLLWYDVKVRHKPYPFGVTDKIACETINIPSGSSKVFGQSIVKGVIPRMECEIANTTASLEMPTLNLNLPMGAPIYLNVTISTSMCPEFSPLSPWLCPWGGKGCGSRSIESHSSWGGDNLTNVADGCDNLFVSTMLDIQHNLTAGPRLNQISILVCKVSYDEAEVELIFNGTSGVFEFTAHEMPDSDNVAKKNVNWDKAAEALPGFSNFNMTDTLYASVLPGVTLQDFRQGQVGDPTIDNRNISQSGDNFGWLMQTDLGSDSLESLLDPKMLKEAAISVHTSLATTMFTSLLRHETNTSTAKSTTGSLNLLQNRLHTQTFITGLLVAGFGILLLLNLLLIVKRPNRVLPYNGNSLLTHARVLSGSSALQQRLASFQDRPENELAHSLNKTTWQAQLRNSCLSIQPTSNANIEEHIEVPSLAITKKWWRPFSTRIFMLLPMAVFPPAVIAILEVMQQESNKHTGIWSINEQNLVQQSIPTLLASLILVTLKMIYDGAHSNTSLLSRYTVLLSGTTSSRPLLQTPSKNHFSSIRASISIKDRTLLLTSIATLLGGFLTIFVSGLFVFHSIPVFESTELTIADRDVNWLINFRHTASYESNDAQKSVAEGTFIGIMWANMTEPNLTYNGLAFPAVKLTDEYKDNVILTKAKIPVWRGDLDCSITGPEYIQMNYPVSMSDGLWTANTSLTIALGDECTYPYKNGSLSSHLLVLNSLPGLDLHNVMAFRYNQTPYIGHVFGNEDSVTILQAYIKTGFFSDSVYNPPQCPSFILLAGQLRYADYVKPTILVCKQYVEQVDVWTTFNPDMTIDRINNPPLIDETSSRNRNYINYSMTFKDSLWKGPANANFLPSQIPFVQSPIYDSGNFFLMLVLGKGGIPADELVGASNSARLLAATRSLYQKYIAQVIIARQYEDRAVQSITERIIPAQVARATELRLIVNPTSKILLQVFLALMGFLMLLALALPTGGLRAQRNAVLHNPATIAGQLVLFAGSGFVKYELDEGGAASMTDGDLKSLVGRIGDRLGETFILGEWHSEEGLSWRIDVTT